MSEIVQPENDLRVVRTMPAQKPGKSKQDYMTPDDFMTAIAAKFGVPEIDLAATASNARCPRFISPEEDSFKQDWDRLGCELGFLNPPFGDIRPWAKKCVSTTTLRILFLVPASVGSNWWADHVDGESRVYFLRPRLSFDGKNPYPKDCALIEYNSDISDAPSYECWNWKAKNND